MASLSDDQLALLRKPALAHIATVMPDGTPQSTPVWIDTDGEAVLFNTARGRAKTRNLERNPAVAISLTDPDNGQQWLEVRGRAQLVDEGADAHIDSMAKKYLGQDTYPYRQPGEQRVIVRVVPEKISGS